MIVPATASARPEALARAHPKRVMSQRFECPSLRSMNPVTHQTIKLSKGRHASPDDGACVMELASMLAGETFSDHPKSVCPVISSFLRTYNDAVDDDRREALYACAAQVIGTRGSREVARARSEYLGSILVQLRLQRHPWTRLVPERVREFLKPRAEMIPARTARMIAVNEERIHLDVRAALDKLVLLGSDAASGGDPGPVGDASAGGPARGSQPERVTV